MGYWRAGFDVVGVDIKPQPNYPFAFRQFDALWYLEETEYLADSFDVIHASPPCQAHSTLARMWNARADNPDLIASTRKLLEATGLPYVIENVVGAPPALDAEGRRNGGRSSIVGVYGHGGDKRADLWPEAMGIDWMTRHELTQAIPPAYTELIGHQLLSYLSTRGSVALPTLPVGVPGGST